MIANISNLQIVEVQPAQHIKSAHFYCAGCARYDMVGYKAAAARVTFNINYRISAPEQMLQRYPYGGTYRDGTGTSDFSAVAHLSGSCLSRLLDAMIARFEKFRIEGVEVGAHEQARVLSKFKQQFAYELNRL